MVSRIAPERRAAAPIECFIMQGECALPAPVIAKFAKTGGQLSKNVFLLREFILIALQLGLIGVKTSLGS